MAYGREWIRIREPSLTTIAIAAISLALYFLQAYSWAFWALVLGIAMSAIKTAVAVAKPDLLLEKEVRTSNLWEEKLVISQYIIRAVILLVLSVAAWNLSELAGYR
jgi:hypothetical protein